MPTIRIALLVLAITASHALSAQDYQTACLSFYNLENLFYPRDEVDVIPLDAFKAMDRSQTVVVEKTEAIEEMMDGLADIDLNRVQDFDTLGDRANITVPADGIPGIPDGTPVLLKDVRDDDNTEEGYRLYTDAVYADKLDRLAHAISLIGTDFTPDGPAVLGVSEVENAAVLRDLAAHPDLADRGYEVIHYNSIDNRGVDVGLLYRPDYFTPTASRAVWVDLWDHRKESRRERRSFTRDVLYVEGELLGETVHILVNHWPSRWGGTAASSYRRETAARTCRRIVDDILADDVDANVIVMGDLNDDPVNRSVTVELDAHGDIDRLGDGQLYNPWVDDYRRGYGSLSYGGTWNLFDQVIVSQGLLDDEGWAFFDEQLTYDRSLMVRAGNYAEGPLRAYGGSRYQMGYSDHLPASVYLVRPLN